MRDRTATIGPTKKGVEIITPERLKYLPHGLQQLLVKIEKNELFSPKYGQMLARDIKLETHTRLHEHPELSLMEVVIAVLKTMPVRMLSGYVKISIDAAIEAWEEHHASLSNSAYDV